VGGIPDVIAGDRDALLVPPEDPEPLGREVIRLLRDVVLRRQLGANAKRVMSDRFRLSESVAKLERLYESALDSMRRAG
jgi:glycosyltransferase involved in cell wall biosynthesis